MNIRSPKSRRIAAVVILVVTIAVMATAIVKLSRTNESLSAQLEQLRKSDKQSFIVRQISKQMEEIAQGQKNISDKRRMEAEEQTEIANSMRLRADEEKRNALTAEGQAIEASKAAQREQRKANEQRQIAESSRNRAIAEKGRADTLAYIALARSLGSKSSFLYNAGNRNLAKVLAYYSWLFTSRYGGNVFDGVVYSALLNASGTKHSAKLSNAAITSIHTINHIVHVTTKYGEVMRFEKTLDRNFAKMLVNAKSYDFRDGCFDGNGKLWSLGVNGQLFCNGERLSLLSNLPGETFLRLVRLGSDKLCAVSTTSLYIVPVSSPSSFKKIASGRFTAVGNKGGNVAVATSGGKLLSIDASGKISKSRLPEGVGQVSSMVWSSEGGAFGNAKGEIFIVDDQGKPYLTIKGHKSRVSNLAIIDNHLYSTGYDGYLYMWNIRGNKYESTTLTHESSWIEAMYIASDSRLLLLGLSSGHLSQIYITPNLLAERIKKSLKSGLSQQDWDYYIGSQIPYENL